MATFVLVHGLMYGGWCWQRLVPLLEDAGHTVHAPTLTGLGERVHLAHPEVDLDTHIADVVGVITGEDLHDVILVGHSYGAFLVTGVADRLPQRIAHLVLLDGVMARDGEALLDHFTEAERAAQYRMAEEAGDGWRLPPPTDPAKFGIFEEADVAWVRSRLTPQPLRTMTQAMRLTRAPFHGPKTLIVCQSAPAAAWRDRMIARVEREGGWGYHELPTGHNAMITMPRPLAELLSAIARSTV